MLLIIILIIAGLILLIKGADWFIDGASLLAKRYHVSELTIGLTIVAFGTSAPELVVNLFAASEGHEEIVFGNVIGSNNFNLFMILGLAGVITPITVQSSTAWKEIPISLAAALALYLLVNDQFISSSPIDEASRIDGLILLVLFALFMYYIYYQLKADRKKQVDTGIVKTSNIKIAGLILLGLAGLIVGGRLVVDNAIKLATILEVSEKIIGLTIIAAGTSLPELATSVMAAIKKNSDMAIGNIIGSNIFNILFILSLSAILQPLSYDNVFNRDLYLLLGGTAFLLIAMKTGVKKKLDRWEALILLISFVAYTSYLVYNEI